MSFATLIRRVLRHANPGGVTAATFALVTVGCSTPQPRADFDSDDPAERLLALERSLQEPRREDIPHLIGMLDSADGAARMLAARQLERMTGHTFGYHHADDAMEREAAVQRWTAWWESGGDGLAGPGGS